MNPISRLWLRIGTATTWPYRLLRIMVGAVLAFAAYQCVTVRFDWPQQALVGLLTVAFAVSICRLPKTESITLIMIGASLLATCRYAVWRCRTVYEAVTNPNQNIGGWDLFFMLLLLGAEVYAFVILFLGYIQTARPLRRGSAPLPQDPSAWPDVDVLIPTYNEPLSVVRSTAFAAANVDYPHEKLHVYILDDGRREEFRAFAEQLGIGYITRKDNRHAKAGNINNALAQLSSPLVAIFDCDHVPTRSFLQVTAGWFLRDAKLGMLQTPHHFYSPDPFERNLSAYKTVPNEGELFYGILQDGNDLWNATFFCGSCAVLRRSALEQIRGIATETVTEDAHTSLRLQMRGWNTAYINIPQAAGLATESLSRHVGQRIRWARGMVQILRINNPLFARGLKLPQRLCYFNAMMHYLFALPRLVFLTAPLIYMLLGFRNIPGHWLAITAYAFPHLVLSSMTNSRIQGEHRHSFWNEVYETVLAPYILGPTLLALISPKLGRFNVTSKGGIVDRSYYDSRIARPYNFLLLMNYVALALAPWRYFYRDAEHHGAVLMNVFWILFNCVIVGTANAVAIESQQRRDAVRLDLRVPLEVELPGSVRLSGSTGDLSLGGGSLRLQNATAVAQASSFDIVFRPGEQEIRLPASVVDIENDLLRFRFEALSLEQEEQLTLLLYSRADTWLKRDSRRMDDKPLLSLLRIFKLSLRGLGYSFVGLVPRRRRIASPEGAAATASAAFLLAFALFGSAHAAAARTVPAGHHGTVNAEAAGERKSFHSGYSLADFGAGDGLDLRGTDAIRSVSFGLPLAQVAESSTLHLRYRFSRKLISEQSHLDVLLNQTLVSTLPVPKEVREGEVLTADLPLPAELLARHNVLTFHFYGHYSALCENPLDSALWANIDAQSRLDVAGSLLTLGNDLGSLPLPFYDDQLSLQSVTIPFAFGAQPTRTSFRAAGLVASWFGVQANSRRLLFPVSLGSVPAGNAVLFALHSSPLLSALGLSGAGPTIAIRTNPSDPNGKLLIVAGDDEDQLLAAAQSLVLRKGKLEGSEMHAEAVMLPAPRRADDAPRWLHADEESSLWSYSEGATLHSDGTDAIPAYVRMPPDLFFGDRATLPLHLGYEYNAASVSPGSFLRLTVNGARVDDLPLRREPGNNVAHDSVVQLPVTGLRPVANTFLFNFYFQQPKHDYCHASTPASFQGDLMRRSYLDLRGIPHWATLPNLELFANAGFPFTRFADLSQTTVVLPDAPTADELSVFLALTGYFGAETGYPALRLELGDAHSLESDRDLLVIGASGHQPVFEALTDKLPMGLGDSPLLTGSYLSHVQRTWWKLAGMSSSSLIDLSGAAESRRLQEAMDHSPDALIEAMESPSAPGRSIVVIALQNENAGSALAAGFLKAADSAQIHGSLSVLSDGRFDSFQIVNHYYHVGSLPLGARLRFWFQKLPWLGVVFMFAFGALLAPWARLRLDRRAEARLRVGEA